MGAGILMSRQQANFAMAQAVARNSGDCGKCPPSAPNGGVTGSRPASGDMPSGGPSPRQDSSHPRTPQGVLSRATGNNPCGQNGDSSQNWYSKGVTGNPNANQPSQQQLRAMRVNPYQQNPLELPDPKMIRQATDGDGNPTQDALSSQGCNCGGGGADMANPDNAQYSQGYQDGSGDPGAEAHPYSGHSDQYYYGYDAGWRDNGGGRRGVRSGTRMNRAYNLRYERGFRQRTLSA